LILKKGLFFDVWAKPIVSALANINTPLKHENAFLFSSSTNCSLQHRGRVQKILLHLNIQLAKACRVKERQRIAFVIEFFVDLLDDYVCKPSILRDAVHTILRLIQYPELQTKAVQLLSKVCKTSLKNNLVELMRHLQLIIASLTQYAVHDNDLGHQALAVIKFLILDSNGSLNEVIKLMDPFPELPLFQQINELYNSLRGTCTLQDEIQRFIRHPFNSQYNINVNLSSRLLHLKTQLATRKEELGKLLQDDNDTSKSREDLAELVWSLLSLCSPQNDEAIKIKAGECLGELGGIKPLIRTRSKKPANGSSALMPNQSVQNALQAGIEIPNAKYKFMQAKVRTVIPIYGTLTIFDRSRSCKD
jgi:hypothetical protein